MSFEHGGSEQGTKGTAASADAAPTPGKQSRTEVVATGEGMPGETAGAAPERPAAAGAGDAQPMNGGAAQTITSETVQKAPDGTAKTRKTVAVGEQVYLSVAEAGDKASWKASAGSGSIVEGDKSQYDWTAPSTPDTVTITFNPGGDGTPSTIQFRVVGVEDIEFTNPQKIMSGKGKAGSLFDLKFLPMNVNFFGTGKTQWKEEDVDPSVADGYFSHVDADKNKHVAGAPATIGDNNKGPKDKVTWSGTGPWEAGTLHWKIPQKYGVDGNWQEIKTFDQITKVDAKGNVTITKNGKTIKS